MRVPKRVGLEGPATFTPPEIALAKRLAEYGSAEKDLVRLIGSLVLKRPDLRVQLLYSLLYYCQARFMLEYYRLSGSTVTSH